jgi:hypothetical protein
MGVFRDVSRASYGKLVNDQLDVAKASSPADDSALMELLRGSDPWQVS